MAVQKGRRGTASYILARGTQLVIRPFPGPSSAQNILITTPAAHSSEQALPPTLPSTVRTALHGFSRLK